MIFPKLTFNKIENGLIFTSDFSTFIKNNVISFSNSGISVIYGPNGTGKTTPQNLKSLREFEESEYNDTLQLLFCVDMLNLGKHIDGEKLDGEVFFRETYSSQVYKQQMGRIMVPEDNSIQIFIYFIIRILTTIFTNIISFIIRFNL